MDWSPKKEPIRHGWPNHADLMQHRSVEDPLVFHVMTRISAGDDATLLRMMAEGVVLVPPSDLPEDWDGPLYENIQEVDVQAGDTQYIFMSPGSPMPVAYTINRPVVAFRLSTLQTHGLVHFRPMDLQGIYADVARFDSDVTDAEGEYFDCTVDPEPVLQAAAEEGQLDPSEAAPLIRLWAHFWAFPDLDDPRRVEAYEELEEFVDDEVDYADSAAGKVGNAASHSEVVCSIPESDDEDYDFDEKAGEVEEYASESYRYEVEEAYTEQLSSAWQGLLTAAKEPPVRLFREQTPEVTFAGHIPLCRAALYYDSATKAWKVPPKDVCEIGEHTLRGVGQTVPALASWGKRR